MTHIHIASPLRSLTPDQNNSVKSDHLISPTDHWIRSPEAPPSDLPLSFLLSPPLPARRRPPKKPVESKCNLNATIKCTCISDQNEKSVDYSDTTDKSPSILPSSLPMPLVGCMDRSTNRLGCVMPNQFNERANRFQNSNSLNYQPNLICEDLNEHNSTPRRIQKQYVFFRLLNWLQRALNSSRSTTATTTSNNGRNRSETDPPVLFRPQTPNRPNMTPRREHNSSHTRSQSQPARKSKRCKPEESRKFQTSDSADQNREVPNNSSHNLFSPRPFSSNRCRFDSRQPANSPSTRQNCLLLGDLSPTGCDSRNSVRSTSSSAGLRCHHTTAFYTPLRNNRELPIIKPVPVKLNDSNDSGDARSKTDSIQPVNFPPDLSCHHCILPQCSQPFASSPQSSSCYSYCSSLQDVENKPITICQWRNPSATVIHHHHHYHHCHQYRHQEQSQLSGLNISELSRSEPCPKLICPFEQHRLPASYHHHHHHHHQQQQHYHHHHYHHHHHHQDCLVTAKPTLDLGSNALSPYAHYATIAELDQLTHPTQVDRLGCESRKISSSSERTSSSSPVITLQFIHPTKDQWSRECCSADQHQQQSSTELSTIHSPTDELKCNFLCLSPKSDRPLELVPLDSDRAGVQLGEPTWHSELRSGGVNLDTGWTGTELANQKSSKNSILESHRKFVSDFMHLKRIGWYWGPLTVTEAELLLKDRPNGTFLVRDSSHDSYMLSVSFRAGDQTCHTRIEHLAGKFSLASSDDPQANASNSVAECIGRVMADSIQDRIRFLPSLQDSSNHSTIPIQPTSQDTRRPGSLIKASLLHPLSRFLIVPSLAHLCRFELLLHVRRDHIALLPLPPALMRYLRENQYYAEMINAYMLNSHNLQNNTRDQPADPCPDVDLDGNL